MPNNSVAILMPIRFIDQSEIDYSFDGDFFIKQKFNFQNPKCYFQPWQRSDDLKLQFISEYIPSDLSFRDSRNGNKVSFASWSEVNTSIVNSTKKVYELEFQMSSLQEGHYYLDFNYTDVDAVNHVMISEPIHVLEVHDNTVLMTYKNSINDFDVIFDTGIDFNFRVRSKVRIRDFKNDRNVYNDQKRNPTLLSAVPYREFEFDLGLTRGVPAWVVDKVNHIQSLDQVLYDNVFYQVPDGAEYEFTQIEYNSYIAGNILLQPNDNNFSRYQTEDQDETITFTPMQKVTPYLNVGNDFAIANIFNAFSLLEKLCIRKRSVDDLFLRVGLTNGGNEIGEFDVDDVSFTQTIEFLFSATQTVFLSGLSGSDVDIWVVWKQLDEPPIILNGGSDIIVPPVGINTVTMYDGTQDQLNVDFDISTGLGRENTNFYGWVMMDGRNGQPNWAGRVPVAQNTADPDFLDLNMTGGEKKHQLVVSELPKFKPSFTHSYQKRGTTGSELLLGDFDQNQTKYGNEVGGDAPHNNLQPYVVTLFIKKII